MARRQLENGLPNHHQTLPLCFSKAVLAEKIGGVEENQYPLSLVALALVVITGCWGVIVAVGMVVVGVALVAATGVTHIHR